MKTSSKGKALIKRFEKYIEQVYDDGYGNLTVGYGHKVVSSDNLKEGDVIDKSRAEELFNTDVTTAEKYVNTLPRISQLKQCEFDAIVSLVFNVGSGPVTDKNNDLYKALNKNTFVEAEVVIGFTYTMGRNKGLVKRRNAELNMFFNNYEETVKIYITMSESDKITTQISVTAQLTIQGSNVSVRDFCDAADGDILGKLNTGDKATAINRIIINGEPWFYLQGKGWIHGDYVEGWVKDYNDNNRWWYVKKNYQYPVSTWETINGADYCFGKDGYLFVYCYIKAAGKDLYYWVDDDGVWIEAENTPNPDRSKYRVVENFMTENAYRG